MRKAESLVLSARTVLKDKKFAKARYLSRKLDISPQLAGQVLSAMPEWSKYTDRRSRNTWIKGVM